MNGVFMMETTYPCLMYALRRVGSNIECTYHWYENELPKLLEPYSSLEDTTGDILVWRKSGPHKKVPVAITADGRVLWRCISYNYHMAVSEGDGYISDMVAGKGEGWAIPFNIRMYLLADTSTPDFYIPRKRLVSK